MRVGRIGHLSPLEGRAGLQATGWGGPGIKAANVCGAEPSPPGLRCAPASLPGAGRESGCVAIQGYASLWNVADLNGDVVARGAFAESLARTGAGGVRMLHQHEARAIVGVWDEIVEDARGLWVTGRIFDWSAEARFAGALARAGALDGLSIGFRAARARRDGRLRVLSAVELWEVSLVTFGACPGAKFRVLGQ